MQNNQLVDPVKVHQLAVSLLVGKHITGGPRPPPPATQRNATDGWQQKPKEAVGKSFGILRGPSESRRIPTS
eukprot:6053506-Pyramimonas_sp.AAC.1